MKWITESRGKTIGLSNAAFGDGTRGKLLNRKKLMNAVIEESAACNNSELVEETRGLLSVDKGRSGQVGRFTLRIQDIASLSLCLVVKEWMR